MAKKGLPLERLDMGYIAGRGKVEVLRWEVIVVQVAEPRPVVRAVNHPDCRRRLWRRDHRLLLLHLDAQDLGLRHRQPHLELSHLVLQVRYRPDATVHRVPHSRIRLVHQAVHRIRPLVSWELLAIFMWWRTVRRRRKATNIWNQESALLHPLTIRATIIWSVTKP